MDAINLIDQTKIRIPEPMMKFYKAHLAMCAALGHPRLRFTLDGRLLGDFGEFLIEKHCDMLPTDKRTPGVDGITFDRKKTVQVKVTQAPDLGPVFSRGEGFADHLIFLWFDFPGGWAYLIYNGPEEPVRKHLPPSLRGSKRVKRDTVVSLAKLVRPEDRVRVLR